MREHRNLKESVDWDVYDQFEDIIKKYMLPQGEGETLASQAVTAVNKIVYKWYNDGDVFDNVHSGLEGWANDLSDYANWLAKYFNGAESILMGIEDCFMDGHYEDLLLKLATFVLDEKRLAEYAECPKAGSIYNCDGYFEFTDDPYGEEEDDDDYWSDYDDEDDEYDEDDDD